MNILDRYMLLQGMNKKLSEQGIQSVAATCLYIAAKLEEIYPPSIDHFANTPEVPLKLDELLELEREIIMAIQWNCTVPTQNNWLGL